MADIAPGRDLYAEGSRTGIIHVPGSEWAREARKWEATYTEFGPGERPYVKREYPTWMFLWGELENGGTGIIASQEVQAMQQQADFESRGFRPEPLLAKAAFEARQLEQAKLAAEREYDKKHRLSPRAVAEVNAIEDAAGSRHLPTIAPTPIRRRGPKPALSEGDRAKRSQERT